MTLRDNLHTLNASAQHAFTSIRSALTLIRASPAMRGREGGLKIPIISKFVGAGGDWG